MELEDVEKRKSALVTILNQMEVPENNKDFHPSRASRNLRWLQRNLAVQNGEHPMFGTAMVLVRDILKNI